MKLKPLNNNVLLKLIEHDDDVNFFESTNISSKIREYKVICIPDESDYYIPIAKGDSVFVNDDDSSKVNIDDSNYILCDINDIYLVRTK